MPNYECLVNTLYSCRNIKHLDYPIQILDREFPLRIDIVCDNGSTWVKGIHSTHGSSFSIHQVPFHDSVCILTVIARNPKSLSDTAHGRSGFGTKTILDQAAEFVRAAEDNQCFFRPPKVSEYNFKTRTVTFKAIESPKKYVLIQQMLSYRHDFFVGESYDWWDDSFIVFFLYCVS